MWHPNDYAKLLAKKIEKHNTSVWLVNTGWTGGAYGEGSRFKLKYTRAIVQAIQSGALDNVETIKDHEFGFEIPKECPGVPSELLQPRNTWSDTGKYDAMKKKLIGLFKDNFKQFESKVDSNILAQGPEMN